MKIMEGAQHKPAVRLRALACSTLWVMEREYFDIILDILDRDGDSIQAVEAQLGRPLENTRTVTNRDGIAVIPVVGPLVRYAGMFEQISGATSVQTLAADFTSALNNPDINGIVFTFDSPGGEVSGINEMANMMYAARGRKPMAGYIEHASSGAYWLASALPHLTIDATAHAGNIGVVYAAENPDAKKQPSRYIEIVSDEAPLKRPDLTTDKGKGQLLRYANETHDVFANSVAQFRGVTRADVAQNFGRGGNRIGADAVKHNMADSVGSMEKLIADMQRKIKKNKPMPGYGMASEGNKDMSILEKIAALINGGDDEHVPEPEHDNPAVAASDNTEVRQFAVSFAEALIGRGDVDTTSPWTISADEENALLGTPPDWAKYAKWFLGKDPSASEQTKAAYKYPHGKAGKVYRGALIAAKQRAAIQGATPIVNAASRLLDMIDSKSKKGASEMEQKDITAIMEENARLRLSIAEHDAKAEQERKEAQKREQAEARSRITAEVAAFTTPLLSANDLRFGKNEVAAIADLLTAIKRAAAGIEHTDAKKLAAVVEPYIVTIVAGAKPLAPTGQLPAPAEMDLGQVSVADFAAQATDPKAAQKIDRVVRERQAKDPKFTERDLLREVKQKNG